MKRRFSSAARCGLTLIELVVVMAIIAVLASMVIPRLDFLKAQAEHSASAGTQGDLGTIIQTFKTSSGKYPTFDTLIASSGNTLYSKLQSQTAGSFLEATTIPTPAGPGTEDLRTAISTMPPPPTPVRAARRRSMSSTRSLTAASSLQPSSRPAAVPMVRPSVRQFTRAERPM